MKTKKSVTAILFLVTAFLLTNCATFKSDIVGKYNAPEVAKSQSEPVRVFFIFSHYRQTKGYDAIPILDNKRERIYGFDNFFNDALKEFTNIKSYDTYTEYASDVNDPRRRALKDTLIAKNDFVIKVKFFREKSFAKHTLGTIFSSLSLTLLPIAYTYDYALDVKVYNRKKRLIKAYKRSAKLTKWVQTFMMFVYPFYPEKRQKEELYVEFMHDIFKQIEAEKILSKS